MAQMRLESNVARIGPIGPLGANLTWAPDIWYDRFSGDELIRRARAEAKASVAGTLILEESENADGSSPTTLASTATVAGVVAELPWTNLTRQYFRIRYVNGATPQTERMFLFLETAGRPVVDNSLLASDGTNLQTLRLDAQRNLLVGLRSSGGSEPSMGSYANSDGLGTGPIALATGAYGLAYNGASWDRWRNNVEGTLLASAARTATTLSANLTNHNARGILIFVSVTSAGTGSLTPSIRWVDPISGGVVNLLVAATAISGTGVYGYEVYPGSSGSAGSGTSFIVQRASGAIGRVVSVRMGHSDASSWTYSVGFALIV